MELITPSAPICFAAKVVMLTTWVPTLGRRMRVSSIFLAATLTICVAWADAANEAVTALKHAYLAAHADNVAEVHANLQRAVNCLVGPKDSQFNSKEANPCAKDGNGAIADTSDPARKKHLQNAVEMAERAIVSSDFSTSIMLATGAAGEIRAGAGAKE